MGKKVTPRLQGQQQKSDKNGNVPNQGAAKNGAAKNGTPKSGTAYQDVLNGTSDTAHRFDPDPGIPARLMPDLPTFPMEVGWRTVYDEETQTHYEIPLTLRDILFPTEDDVGAVYMSQGLAHNWLITHLTSLLMLYLGKRGWFFPNDVLILWGVSGVPPKSPDITAIPDVGELSMEGKGSFRVERDGPIPAAVIEITSPTTRHIDFDVKPTTYASIGIREYLVIDILNDASEPWRLHGYRLNDFPFYDEITPDADGAITLESMKLRFVPVGRERIDIYDINTGERLYSPREYEELAIAEAARAEAEAARAEAEAARAEAGEETIEELKARIRELEADKNNT